MPKRKTTVDAIHEFNDIIQESDEAVSYTHNMTLWPKKWNFYKGTQANRWKFKRLKIHYATHIPRSSGIYTLIIMPGVANHPLCGYLMYVGQAKCLNARFKEYLTKERQERGRPKIMRLLWKYDSFIWFCFSEIGEKHLKKEEDALIEAYVPPCNDKLPASISAPIRAFKS